MLMQELADLYGAARLDLRKIRDGQGGASVFEATVDGERRALRISGPFLSGRPQWVEFEGALLKRANDEGVPVAAAIPGADGRFGQRIDEGVVLLTEWATGDVEWPAPPHKAHRLGQAIANLHWATETLSWETPVRPFDTAGLLDRPIALLNEVVDAEPLRPFVEEMRGWIDAIPRTPTTFGPVHGDVHQGNCHFDEDETTLFDFAQCGIGWRAFDLAGFLWPWRDDTILKPEMRATCNAYLKGYESVRPLTAKEKAALPAFIRARDLWEAGEWIATRDGREKAEHVKAGIQTWAQAWAKRTLGAIRPM